MRSNARHGFIITTAPFSSSARSFTECKPMMDDAYSALGSDEILHGKGHTSANRAQRVPVRSTRTKCLGSSLVQIERKYAQSQISIDRSHFLLVFLPQDGELTLAVPNFIETNSIDLNMTVMEAEISPELNKTCV